MAGKKKDKSEKLDKKKRKFDVDEAAAALPAETRRMEPTLPVDVAVLEAYRLAKAAEKLRAKLIKLPGFDAGHIDNLPALIDGLEESERNWARLRLAKKGKGRGEARKEAEALRKAVLGAGRYLFRKNPKALKELERIAEGEGLADLLADLKDIPLFMTANPREWALDITLPKDAKARCTVLGKQLEEVEDDEEALAAFEARNQRFVLLDQSVTEVREAARYLLGDDRKRLAPFLSRYEADRKRRARQHHREAKSNKPAAEKVDQDT